MSQIEVGNIVTGKVTGIQPYGAFVGLNETTQGLIHISEITYGYVKDINEYLAVGDDVKVKVLSVNKESGKVSLSLRAVNDIPKKTIKREKTHQSRNPMINQLDNEGGFNTLKEKLSEWIARSEREDLMKK